jgi:hypothetical protein
VPTMKKCRRGNGTMLTASLRRSELSWPGNCRARFVCERLWNEEKEFALRRVLHGDWW